MKKKRRPITINHKKRSRVSYKKPPIITDLLEDVTVVNVDNEIKINQQQESGKVCNKIPPVITNVNKIEFTAKGIETPIVVLNMSKLNASEDLQKIRYSCKIVTHAVKNIKTDSICVRKEPIAIRVDTKLQYKAIIKALVKESKKADIKIEEIKVISKE